MKTLHVLALASGSALFLSSCSTGTYASQNISSGALLGAAAGAVIGHQSGNALEGAALGGVAGGLAGNAMTPPVYNQGYQNTSYQGNSYGPERYDDFDEGFAEPAVVYRNSYHYSTGYSPFFHAPVYDPFPRRYGYARGYDRCRY
ncbi:glycine zipper 2TM domain-containing protein [Verrucomicrobiaceae bacterium 227]